MFALQVFYELLSLLIVLLAILLALDEKALVAVHGILEDLATILIKELFLETVAD